MTDVKCELCPISSQCEAFKEVRRESEYSYHPQNVVRVGSSHCPLVLLAKAQVEDKE